MEADAAVYKLEAEAMSGRKENGPWMEPVTPLKGDAYELQRKTWQRQLQPYKARRKKATAKETKKDREEM